MARSRPGNKNQGTTLSITSLNEFGYGVGQKAGQIITVARTAPGDQVQVGPPRNTEKWTSADLVKVVQAGPDRIESPCRAFVQGCGGCQWLHLGYSAQLAWKEKNLASILHTRAGFRGKINPILPMQRPEAYRNKLSLKNVHGKLVFLTETEGTQLTPKDCFVQTAALQKAWSGIRNHKVHPGIEQIHLRSNEDGQVGIHAFVKHGVRGWEEALTSLFEACPGAIGLGATSRQGYRHYAGAPVLIQKLGNAQWLIPHNGFFQTNAIQAGILLDLVRRESNIRSSDRVLDLYCGAGFFGLSLAPLVREVIGIEENAQSVEAAKASARESRIDNARFFAGDLGKTLTSIAPVPDEVAVVDPPREGLLPFALQALIVRSPRRIVYISCYPQSLVRDFKLLVAAGWHGVSCTPIDMFPHTSHLEAILTLEK